MKRSNKSKTTLNEIIAFAGVYFNDSRMIKIVDMAKSGLSKDKKKKNDRFPK
jgi:hypothetical protein